MSTLQMREWLISKHSVASTQGHTAKLKKAKTISFASGKGGVGKTSMAVKMSSLLVAGGYKVLLIDCDYNLSNSMIKLGFPVNDNFYSLISAKRPFEECLHRENNLHILSGCNANLEIFENGLEMDKLIIDIISAHEREYDYIILDCAAGLGKDMVTLNAYCDHRFIIVTPDKSSITDSYGLMKILKHRHDINENHLLLNKVSSGAQYKRVVKSMCETVEDFLSGRLHLLGYVSYESGTVDQFDKLLLKDAASKIHDDIFKIVKKFSEESVGLVGLAL